MSVPEHQRNEEILEESKVEPITIVTRRRKLEWYVRHVKRRDETENIIRAVAEMKMGQSPRGTAKLRWKYTVKGHMKAWKIRVE